VVCIIGISNAGVDIAVFLQSIKVPCKVFLQENSVYANALKAKLINFTAADLDNLDLLFFKGDTLEGVTSVIFPSEDESFNLRAAMYAYELNRELKVVVRLFNLNMAKKLESSIPNFTVLSVSLLASAAFAAVTLLESPVAAFMTDSGAVALYNVQGVKFDAMNVTEAENKYDIKIIFINGAMFPQSTVTINCNDTLTVLSSIETSIKLTGICCGTKKGSAGKEKKTFHFKNLLKSDRILTTTVATLFFILTASSLFFHYYDGLSLIDAIYFTITIMTTVGFGDFNLKDSTTVSKITGMFVMISGAVVTTVFFAILTGYMLKKRLDLRMGHKRFNVKDHVVLCGIGDVGVRVLNRLISLGQKVVVIEKNPENKHIPLVTEMGIPIIISEAVSIQTLVNANIVCAKSIIACTNDDMKNLEIALNARSLNSDIRAVLRIYDVDFARILEKHFDVHYALSSAFLAAPVFAYKALGLDIAGVFSVGDQTYKVVNEKEGDKKLCITKII
jgi:voltage-gated potassium channel Kch